MASEKFIRSVPLRANLHALTRRSTRFRSPASMHKSYRNECETTHYSLYYTNCLIAFQVLFLPSLLHNPMPSRKFIRYRERNFERVHASGRGNWWGVTPDNSFEHDNDFDIVPRRSSRLSSTLCFGKFTTKER